MEAGKNPKPRNSPIVTAIARAERVSTGEIRVHLSRRRWERDPLARARLLFQKFGMHATRERNGVLLYVNLRKRVFAVVGDEGIHKAVGADYWQELMKALREDLHSTHIENAIALAVQTIGFTLQRYFPAKAGDKNPNELPDIVSED